jgi:hypothetical protein
MSEPTIKPVEFFTRGDILKAFCIGQRLHTSGRITEDGEGNEWTRGGEPLLHFAERVVADLTGTTEPCTCHLCVGGIR